MSVLSPEIVQEKLRSLPHWKLEGKEIVRHCEFPDFAAAMAFVNQVAEKAEGNPLFAATLGGIVIAVYRPTGKPHPILFEAGANPEVPV